MENKKSILSIDDNNMTLELFQKMLEPEYDVHLSASASEALHVLNTTKIDIILLDIEMPNISGFQFLHDIRTIPSYIDVPIIIVSGNKEEEFFEKARNSTAFDVIIKPVKREQLIESIKKAFS